MKKTLLATALAALSLSAHADDPFLPRVTIDASRISQLGIADSAAEGTVTQRQLAARTTYRPGELLEATPGLVASQHSGEGKANQFYLRGFNLDHGTDLRTTVDGMPVNQRSHAHGQGWTDLNFVIPELATRLDYRKGPYSVYGGDFASAGATDIAYAGRLTRGIANLTVGQNGYGRILVAGSSDIEAGAQAGSLLYALETMHNDGPFTRGDNYRKVNGVLRYSEGFANNGFHVTAMAYRAGWNATDQIPQRAVDNGTLGRFDAIDPTDGGSAHRYSLSAAWARTTEESSARVSAYAIANRLALFSNFTYFMDDPVNGDQFAQPDRRVTSGVDASYAWHAHGANGSFASTTTVGFTAQNDNIHNGLYSTKARRVIATTRQDHIVETSGALFVENQTRWNPVFRTVAGLRADRYRFDVASDRAVNTGKANDTMASPTASLIFGPWANTEFYVNAGTGFHSNDARGTVIAVDPKTNAPADRVTPLARTRGLDLGVRSEWFRGLQTSLSLYRLDMDSELVFVGDAGTTEAGRPSRRHGIELSNYYKPFRWLSLDADLAYARGRYRDGDAAGDRIPGAVEGVAQFAATVTPAGPWSGALRLRWFGPRPLVEDDSIRSAATMTLNGRIGYRVDRNLQVELEAFNLTNRRDAAITYYYASQLKDEAAPVDDHHFHPIESRSLRLTLAYSF
ncbi:TonB-dependent receptor plug domain-containing protein [Massilia dura]|uniref:TonB-dependent receptor plug domain-containing protein n=1 Tax=Pseudoduganella dura TaxID=321982 RepID=A0A6I3XLG7_9BURK|nr:TonB-dependent receptor [Pseudoduganella dura]MUI14521.1 TonB-dependent receptor plug domain-containing protein [Pseudoduganella dura]GGY16914.1 TonB-dependent receptor [Pseudoduganella dura]